MFDQLTARLGEGFGAAEQVLGEVDAGSLIGSQPGEVIEMIALHERKVAAVRLAVTARAAEMQFWQQQGFASFEDWLAATHGGSHGNAKRRTATARKVNDRPRTAKALADGHISEDQADTVADAAAKNPAEERRLLDTARNKGRSDKDLKDQAARAKAAAEDDRARAERLRNGRRARWGPDRDGFWAGSTRQQPHVGAEMAARLDAETERRFRAARKAGHRAPRERYRADALAALILGHDPGTGDPASRTARAADTKGGAPADAPTAAAPAPTPARGNRGDDAQPPAPAADGAVGAPAAKPPVARTLVFDIDLEAYRRGQALTGETCEIRGLGPAPVEVAHQWADDAFIKALIRDGTDIKKVAHFGRHIPETLRTALEFRDRLCVVPRCDNPRIEFDHHQRHTDHGPCSLDNLRGPCTPHHRQITHHGYRLEGGPGHWRWIGPDGDVLATDDPADLPQDTRGP